MFFQTKERQHLAENHLDRRLANAHLDREHPTAPNHPVNTRENITPRHHRHTALDPRQRRTLDNPPLAGLHPGDQNAAIKGQNEVADG